MLFEPTVRTILIREPKGILFFLECVSIQSTLENRLREGILDSSATETPMKHVLIIEPTLALGMVLSRAFLIAGYGAKHVTEGIESARILEDSPPFRGCQRLDPSRTGKHDP
jgi:hypothetical protein